MDFSINEQDTIVVKSNNDVTLYIGIDYDAMSFGLTVVTEDGTAYTASGTLSV